MTDLREKISDNISTWHYDLLLGKHVKESSFDLASGIISMVLDEAIEAVNYDLVILDPVDREKAIKAIEKLKTTSD